MPLPSIITQAYSRWVSWFLRQGETEPEVQNRFEQRHPNLPESRWRTAIRFARQMLAVGARALRLAPPQQLEIALGRAEQPAPTVEVSWLAEWQDMAGNVYHNTIKVEARWDQPKEEVEQAAAEILGQIVGRYPGAVVQKLDLIPSMLWPGEAGQ